MPERARQRRRVGGDDGVGSVGAAPLHREAVAVDAGAKAVLAQAQLVGAVGGCGAARREQGLEGDHERIGADGGVVGGRERGHAAPAPEREHDGLELGAAVGERVDLGARRRWQLVAHHHPRGLEVAQALGEDVGAQVGQAGAQVGEALGPQQQLAHDEQGPALAPTSRARAIPQRSA